MLPADNGQVMAAYRGGFEGRWTWPGPRAGRDYGRPPAGAFGLRAR